MSGRPLYHLDKLHALSDGNSEFVKHMVNMFVKMIPEFYERIESSYQKGDMKDVGDAAHKIKPTLDMMAIDNLYEPIRDLEKHGRAGEDPEQVRSLMDTVKGTLDQVCDQLQNP